MLELAIFALVWIVAIFFAVLLCALPVVYLIGLAMPGARVLPDLFYPRKRS